MANDPFSEILRFAHARSLVTGGFSADVPWGLRFPAPDKVKFFAIVKGQCWVKVEGESSPRFFGTGDVGLIAVARSFVVCSDVEVQPLDAMDVFSRAGRNVAQLGEGRDFEYLGGHVLLDPHSSRFFTEALPPWIHIPASSAKASAFSWLLRQLVQEQAQQQPGASLATAQLSQLLFIQILRAHLDTDAPRPVGWFRALGDVKVAPAIRLIHGKPGSTWDLATLARECAMSRTAFASRFKEMAGMTPMAYLTHWRMCLAQQALRESDTPVAAIAHSVGYSSESAFSNAFKKHSGAAPQLYRKAGRSSAPET